MKYKKYLHSGDWHLHTYWTDGRSSPAEYFQKAEDNGLEFLLFSEHVRKNIDYDYEKFKAEVQRAGAKSRIKFAVGAEVKVLDVNGTLDISEKNLAEADVILFAFHSKLFSTKEEYIQAIINAIKNPVTDIWAHPTAYHTEHQLFLDTDDWNKIAQFLREFGVCYEINKKYPFPSKKEIAAIRNAGIPIVVGSDAHHYTEILTHMDIKYLKRSACDN